MISKTQALLKLCPGAEWFMKDDVIVKWYSKDIAQPSEEEIQTKIVELEVAEPMRLLRLERNRKLVETDWRMVEDYPMTNKLEWKTYRQALRDLPATANPQLDERGNLVNVTWPEVPE